MANNIYNPGLFHVGSFQVSGRPFGATGSLNDNTETINFPHVTKQIVVLNTDTGTDPIYAYFHTGSQNSNKFPIQAGNQMTFNVKTDKIILSSSVSPDYTLYASLTAITSSLMYSLTGSGVTE